LLLIVGLFSCGTLAAPEGIDTIVGEKRQADLIAPERFRDAPQEPTTPEIQEIQAGAGFGGAALHVQCQCYKGGKKTVCFSLGIGGPHMCKNIGSLVDADHCYYLQKSDSSCVLNLQQAEAKARIEYQEHKYKAAAGSGASGAGAVNATFKMGNAGEFKNNLRSTASTQPHDAWVKADDKQVKLHQRVEKGRKKVVVQKKLKNEQKSKVKKEQKVKESSNKVEIRLRNKARHLETHNKNAVSNELTKKKAAEKVYKHKEAKAKSKEAKKKKEKVKKEKKHKAEKVDKEAVNKESKKKEIKKKINISQMTDEKERKKHMKEGITKEKQFKLEALKRVAKMKQAESAEKAATAKKVKQDQKAEAKMKSDEAKEARSKERKQKDPCARENRYRCRVTGTGPACPTTKKCSGKYLIHVCGTSKQDKTEQLCDSGFGTLCCPSP